ncbi:MAG: galactokinase family protein, partial [Eubacteriales bacterium]
MNKFTQKYNNKNINIKIAKSPLRMCPLGAHVDHQEGLVTGIAFGSSVDMVFVPNDDGYIRVQS